MDYVAKTIQAYDAAPDKYASATGDMVNIVEMDLMLSHMPSSEKKILDVGCGPGRDAHVLDGKGYRIIGIDLSKELLKKARELHSGLEFEQMDVRKLEFPDNTFGAVWCNAVLLHLNDKDLEIALQEIFRVLTPQGILAASFKKGSGERELLETFSTDLSRYYNFKSQEALSAIVEEQGFQVIESHVLNERERFGQDKRDLDWVWTIARKP